MKHSALALALLASRISSSAGQGGGGGGGAVVPRYEKISLLRRGADPAALASSSSSLSNTATATADDAAASPPSSDDDEENDDMAIQAKCQPLRESECDRARDCTWCVSRAVPSKCYASSLVARLPAKTFECAAGTTTASASSSESSAEKKKKKEEKNEVFEVFDFDGRHTLTLSSAEVDKTFCDASSPISLAGYMNGEQLFNFYIFRLGWGREGRNNDDDPTRRQKDVDFLSPRPPPFSKTAPSDHLL